MATKKTTTMTEVPMTVKPTGVAGRYGIALYELAVADKSADKLMKEIASFKSSITDELTTFLGSPAFETSSKRLVIDEILTKAKASKLLSNFVKLVVEKDRGGYLAQMLAVVESLHDAANGVVNAEVTSATKLTADQLKSVEKFVKSTVPAAKGVELKTAVNEKLIAGMKVRIGAVEYDASMANQLSQLGRSLREQAQMDD